MSDWFIVGEHGPELAWIPAGSAVIPVQPAMEDPPDTSWLEYDEIGGGPPVLAYALFLVTLVMAAACIALLFA